MLPLETDKTIPFPHEVLSSNPVNVPCSQLRLLRDLQTSNKQADM